MKSCVFVQLNGSVWGLNPNQANQNAFHNNLELRRENYTLTPGSPTMEISELRVTIFYLPNSLSSKENSFHQSVAQRGMQVWKLPQLLGAFQQQLHVILNAQPDSHPGFMTHPSGHSECHFWLQQVWVTSCYLYQDNFQKGKIRVLYKNKHILN